MSITLREFLLEEILKKDGEEVLQCYMVTIESPKESDSEVKDQILESQVNEIRLCSGLSIPRANRKKEISAPSASPKKLKAKNHPRKCSR